MADAGDRLSERPVEAPFNEAKKNRTMSTTSIDTTSTSGTAGVNRKLNIDDFTILKTLGRGTFGEVLLAKSKIDKKKYAIKMLSKEFMERVVWAVIPDQFAKECHFGA